MELTKEIMYKAILEKDIAFEGIFFTAVKTTGIFCRPSCTARKPKFENVEFFKTTKECIQHGYRPCKTCNPLETINKIPDKFQQIIKELIRNPEIRFKDHDLKQRGIEPNQIRRWFIKNYGITFQAYQRMIKINIAFKKIKKGGNMNITQTAFSTGFDSLSGFGERFKNTFGTSPKHTNHQNIVDLKKIETPLGTMLACATNAGVCLLEFSDKETLETEFNSIEKALNAKIILGENIHLDELEHQLKEYFEGKRKKFSVPLNPVGTEFQNKVWKVLQTIPYGKTMSYKQQAIAIANPKSVRAVANANGKNKISILIPCHRVIGTNGLLTGYAGGLWRKKFLLELENKQIIEEK